MARSGLAAAEVLNELGARVTLYDSASPEKLEKALAAAKDLGIDAHAQANVVGDSEELVVTSPGVRKHSPVLTNAAQRGLPIWGEIEAAYRIAKAPILAITGTNGKTTTTALVGEIAREAGYRTYVAGNIAAGQIAMPLIKAAANAEKDDVIVAEISSFQLEWTPSFRPAVAAVLNITPDHADRQSWEEYVAAKWNIFAHQVDGDVSVMRSDIPWPDECEQDGRSRVVYFDQISRPSWVHKLLIPGEHNIENAMAALAITGGFGIDEEIVQRAALKFVGVVHRMERVRELGGVVYINNSMCTNNAAFASSLRSVDGSKIVLAGGVFKGGSLDEMAQAAISESVRRLVLFGRSGADIEQAVRRAGFERVDRFEKLPEAVLASAKIAQPGDTVVLNPGCASFDEFDDFEHRGNVFKEIVMNLS